MHVNRTASVVCRMWWRRTAAYIPVIFMYWMDTALEISIKIPLRKYTKKEQYPGLWRIPAIKLHGVKTAGTILCAGAAAAETVWRRNRDRL